MTFVCWIRQTNIKCTKHLFEIASRLCIILHLCAISLKDMQLNKNTNLKELSEVILDFFFHYAYVYVPSES